MDTLDDVRNRQWPLPKNPWILRQAWNDLLFAHWPIARDRLRELVPRDLDLDLYENEAWVSVAPFRLTDLSPRGVPALPWISSFNEINVRTYVVRDGMPGVYFFSLDADSVMAVAGASSMFHLPYFLAAISMENDRGRLRFQSARTSGADARFDVQYNPDGSLFEPEKGSLDYFLTERYCLYTHDSSGKPYRVEIHHRPWQLQSAEMVIATNTMIDAAGLRLPSVAPVAHFARRQDVVTWSPRLLG